MTSVMNQEKQSVHPIKIRNCTFRFRCEAQWEDMKETYYDLELVDSLKMRGRFCGICEKQIYLISNKDELMNAIKFNQCVAIEVPDSIKTEHFLGSPVSYDDPFDDVPF